MMTVDKRPHRLVDVSELRAGDVVLSWYPDDVNCYAGRVVASVDLRPLAGGGWATDITYADGHRVYNAEGVRKVRAHEHTYRWDVADWWCKDCDTVTDYCAQV